MEAHVDLVVIGELSIFGRSDASTGIRIVGRAGPRRILGDSGLRIVGCGTRSGLLVDGNGIAIVSIGSRRRIGLARNRQDLVCESGLPGGTSVKAWHDRRRGAGSLMGPRLRRWPCVLREWALPELALPERT